MNNPPAIIKVPGPALNSVGPGLALAADAIAFLQDDGTVLFDFSEVERITPSCANAIVMTLLDSVGKEIVRASVIVSGANEVVAEAWSLAVDRYERGIRLSTQRNQST